MRLVDPGGVVAGDRISLPPHPLLLLFQPDNALCRCRRLPDWWSLRQGIQNVKWSLGRREGFGLVEGHMVICRQVQKHGVEPRRKLFDDPALLVAGALR